MGNKTSTNPISKTVGLFPASILLSLQAIRGIVSPLVLKSAAVPMNTE
jgi:hypothetical protein